MKRFICRLTSYVLFVKVGMLKHLYDKYMTMGKRRSRPNGKEQDDDEYDDRETKNSTGGISGGGVQVEFAEFVDRDNNVASFGEEGDALEMQPNDTEAVSVELGSTDPADIENEFNINLDNTRTVEEGHKIGELDDGEQYEKLTTEERKKFLDALKEKHGKEAKVVYNYMREWKNLRNSSQSNKTELTGKRALGIGAETRSDEIFKKYQTSGDETEARVKAFRDYARLSQAMMKKRANDDGTINVHRGLKSSSSAEVAKQIINNPNQNSYNVKLGAVENFSGIERIGQEFAGNGKFVASTSITPDEVVMNTDGIVTEISDTVDIDPACEDEISVAGGVMKVDATDMNTGGDTDTQFSAERIGEVLQNPSEGTEKEHREISNMVEHMKANNVSVGSKEGRKRLQRWKNEVNGNDKYTSAVKNIVASLGSYI